MSQAIQSMPVEATCSVMAGLVVEHHRPNAGPVRQRSFSGFVYDITTAG